MRFPLRLPRSSFLPTLAVVIVVLVSGGRLISLSVQHHAAIARAEAAGVVAAYVAKIEPALAALAALADKEADAAAKTPAAGPSAGTFWMGPDDAVLRTSAPSEGAAAAGIASEWDAARAGRTLPAEALLGPMRLGSQWLIAIRAPIAAAGGAAVPAKGWAVAYADLDELVADAHLARLIDAGYDFQLSQFEPRSGQPRAFVSSTNDPLVEPVAAQIRLPTAPAIAGSYLELSIRPRVGWIPFSVVASEIGLLVFLVWLLAFGTHDLMHSLGRARLALAASRRRVHALNERLAAEIKQRLTLQESFDFARFHDTFTGLPNRRYFMDQLDRALREVRTRHRQRIAVILIDIARFKVVNYMLGHTAGDDLMVQVARRFEQATSGATLARWGGDQFALLLFDAASADEALRTATLLQEQLREPFQLRRHKLMVTATLGVTCVDSGQQRAEDVVREADIALSVAKREEVAKAILYTPAMVGQSGQSANLVSLEADLHVALEKHQLRLVFQPIVDLRTYQMVGAEALLRWRHPVEGVLAPDRFLRIAEDAGLMVPITRWVILKVIKLAGEWLQHLPPEPKFYISINLSPAALRDPELSTYLAELLKESGLPPYMLKLELTELALVANVAGARDSLAKLHDMGIQLMLDDFGTGYSSISNLQLFPFDVVKIDCPFVNRRGSDEGNMSMIAGMVQIAESLDLSSIAEMVEGNAAASALRDMGCEYGQGFYFSEPIEADAVLERLRSRAPFEPTDSTSDTLMPLDATSDTLMPLTEDSSPTSDTLMPIAEDDSATRLVPVLEVALVEDTNSETMILRPLSEDSSQTMMLPIESIKFPIDPSDYGDEDEDE